MKKIVIITLMLFTAAEEFPMKQKTMTMYYATGQQLPGWAPYMAAFIIASLFVPANTFQFNDGFVIPDLSPACDMSMAQFEAQAASNSNAFPLTQLVTASGNVPGSLGNYWQCSMNTDSQYCLVTAPYAMLLTNTTHYLYNAPTATGLCFPSACNEMDIKLISVYFYYPVYMNQAGVSVSNISDVQCLMPNKLEGAAAILTVVLIVLLSTLVIIGTVYKYVITHRTAKASADGEDASLLMLNNGNQADSSTPKDTSKAPASQKLKLSKSAQVLCAFDVVENFNELSKSPGGSDGFKALDGLRTITMVCL